MAKLDILVLVYVDVENVVEAAPSVSVSSSVRKTRAAPGAGTLTEHTKLV